jgi:hypothetical protein
MRKGGYDYTEIDATPYKYKTFLIVDYGFSTLGLLVPNTQDTIYAYDDLNTNFIMQKHYDLARKTCIGKTYRNTGESSRLGFWRDYKTRKPLEGVLSRTEDLKCIDVFVDTVHYKVDLQSDDSKDWTKNIATLSGSRLCLLFETAKYGKIFCPVEESEVLHPDNIGNYLNMGQVLTLKKNSAVKRPQKRSTATRKRTTRRK